MTLDVGVETVAFQAYAEGYRAACDSFDGSDESAALVDLMFEDMKKAEAQMERAWLERMAERS